MHQQRFVRNIRLAKKDDDGCTFLRAAVWAEMSKSTSYIVDIKLDKDMIIDEAQCECGAGAGPTAHCKHVSLVFHALVTFVGGKPLVTDLTCTEKLQTFHRTKPNTGTPVKSETLVKLRGLKTDPIYDPRPVQYRSMAGWNAQILNMCINHAANNPDGARMPILQLTPPANFYALYDDHDYFKLHMVDYFLELNNLSVITAAKVEEIEQLTRQQNKSEDWYLAREMRITSSNFGRICKSKNKCDNWKENGCEPCNGLSNEVCPQVHSRRQKMARDLMTRLDLNTKAIRHGRQYEPVAIKKYEDTNSTEVKKCGLFVSKDRPFLGSSPDGLLGDDDVIEVKCPYTAKGQTITHKTVPYFTQNGELKKEDNYYYQVQGQLYCTKRNKAKFIIFTLKDLKVIDIPTDPPFIQEMISRLDTFYVDYFKPALLEKYLYRNYHSYSFD